MPQVSVVLPTFNRAASLPRAIRSVLNQTLADIELIVVDDGSTDGTRDILGKIADTRLRVIYQPSNKGAAAARNAGIAAARSAWIAFQDSDDEWLSEKLQRQLETLDSAPNCRVCYTGRVIYGLGAYAQFGKGLVSYTPEAIPGEAVEGDVRSTLRRRNLMANTQLMVSREVIESIGGYDETLGNNQDWDLVFRLARKTPFSFVDDPLVVAFTSGDSISKNHLMSARTKTRILEKYATEFAKDPAAHAVHYYYAGLIENRYGDLRAAQRNFGKAIACHALNWRAWIGFAASGIGLRIPRRAGSA